MNFSFKMHIDFVNLIKTYTYVGRRDLLVIKISLSEWPVMNDVEGHHLP